MRRSLRSGRERGRSRRDRARSAHARRCCQTTSALRPACARTTRAAPPAAQGARSRGERPPSATMVSTPLDGPSPSGASLPCLAPMPRSHASLPCLAPMPRSYASLLCLSLMPLSHASLPRLSPTPRSYCMLALAPGLALACSRVLRLGFGGAASPLRRSLCLRVASGRPARASSGLSLRMVQGGRGGAVLRPGRPRTAASTSGGLPLPKNLQVRSQHQRRALRRLCALLRTRASSSRSCVRSTHATQRRSQTSRRFESHRDHAR